MQIFRLEYCPTLCPATDKEECFLWDCIMRWVQRSCPEKCADRMEPRWCGLSECNTEDAMSKCKETCGVVTSSKQEMFSRKTN